MPYRRPTRPTARAVAQTTLASLALAALAACGGGGGGGSAAALASGPSPAVASGADSTAAAGAPGAIAAPGTTATPTAAQLQRSDFQVNTTTDGDQDSGALARLAGGGFVAVWTSHATSPGNDVRLQRYDAQLQPLGTETLVSASGFAPGVAPLPGGGFVVSWSDGPYIYEANGHAQVFDANGVTTGARLTLATTFYKYLTRPAALADGSFVVAADTIAGKYGAEYGTLTRYAADGSALGAAVRLEAGLDAPGSSAYDTNHVFDVNATGLPGGGFAAAWIASGSSQTQLRLALFDGGGAQQGAYATLAAEPGLRAPSLATLADGGFVVAWQAGAPAGPKTVIAERFDSSGRSLGRQTVASDASADRLQPQVAALADGGYVVAWRDMHDGADAMQRQAFAQRFSAGGAAVGSADAIGQVSVPFAGRSNFNDTLAVAGSATGGYLVLHGSYAAAGGWEVRGASR